MQGKEHGLSQKEGQAVADQVERWAGICPFASELQVPAYINEPIAELPLYTDGLMCQLEPGRCQYICRSKESIKEHWRKQHAYSVGTKGRPGVITQRRIKRRFQEACKPVHCQRYFPSRHGSQFFEVRQPDQAHESQARFVNGEQLWEKIQKNARDAWEEQKRAAQQLVEEHNVDEGNPWLERTGWSKYLQGIDRDELLTSIEPPQQDPTQQTDVDQVEVAIWKAIEKVARVSQTTVNDRVGVYVRLEAIRDQQNQIPYQPLKAYMEGESIERRVLPWRQIMMFFVRTQREHEWTSPQYRFTQYQATAFERLIREAEWYVGGAPTEDRVDRRNEEDIDERDTRNTRNEEEEDQQEDQQAQDNSDNEEEQQDSGRLTPIQQACLDFAIALLDHKTKRKEYDSALVCAAAVLGLSEHGWKGPESYPPVLSAIIKVSRFFIVQKAYIVAQAQNEEPDTEANRFWREDSGYESDWASQSSRTHQDSQRRQQQQDRSTCLGLVVGMVEHFGTRGSHSPMQWFLDLRTYGMKIHYNTTTQGHIDWYGRDEILYKGLQFSMAQFRSMIHGTLSRARELLFTRLLFDCSDVPSVPWGHIRDDPTNTTPNWNFLQDQRTRMPVDGSSWLFERVRGLPDVRARFSRPSSQVGVQKEAVQEYAGEISRFKEMLLVLAHITGGQPARGTEILSVRHSNTSMGGHRSIFVEDGLVVLVTRYHKGFIMSGDNKIIHRYLPREVGELFVYFLWLVIPFQQQLEAYSGRDKAISAYMWAAEAPGKKWTSEQLKNAIKRESKIGLGQELHIQSYRDIAIGISRRFMRGKTAFDSDKEQEDSKDEDEEGIADLQAGHTSHIAGLIYARGIMERTGVVASKRQLFRASSVDWHVFLAFESTWADTGGGVKDEKSTGKRLCPFEVEAEEERMQRWRRLRDMNSQQWLQRLKGENATFRGTQEPAIEAIKAGVSPIVAVMPTGAGKSLLFMLPAMAEPSGVTVVVVPLIALRADMKRRCDEVGIECVEWSTKRPADGSSIVLVTPESAVSESFMTYLNRMKATQRLDRIVIDECHVILNEQVDFRKQLQRLGVLVGAEAQMVLLTATLPPCEEDTLFKRMSWIREEVSVFRAATSRSNIQYSVVQAQGRSKQDRSAQLTALVEQQLQQGGKVVVYSNSRAEVQRITEAGLFVCEAFHSQIAVQRKHEVLDKFRAGQTRVLVATSAFGMGVDITDIRLIVHVDEPRCLLDYGQESGRAGRDGVRSRAVIIIGGQRSEDRLVRAFLGGSRCRRVVLDEYLDGNTARRRCTEGEERCDICSSVDNVRESEQETGLGFRGDIAGLGFEEDRREQEGFTRQGRERSTARRRRNEATSKQSLDIEELISAMERWKRVCVICRLAGRESRHSISECDSNIGRQAEQERKGAQRRIRYEQYAGCVKCGLPFAVCSRWTAKQEGGGWVMKAGGWCQFYGILFGVLYGVKWGRREIWGRFIERLRGRGVDIEREEAILGYLGGREKGGEQVEGARVAWEVLRIIRQVESI